MKECPEDFPWGEFLKECIPLAVVLVIYFAVQFAISAESIAWMRDNHELHELHELNSFVKFVKFVDKDMEVAK